MYPKENEENLKFFIIYMNKYINIKQTLVFESVYQYVDDITKLLDNELNENLDNRFLTFNPRITKFLLISYRKSLIFTKKKSFGFL